MNWKPESQLMRVIEIENAPENGLSGDAIVGSDVRRD
jgi:hypothetical protein